MSLVGQPLYDNELKVVYCDQDLEIGYANPGDAGIDLRASKPMTIPPEGRALVPCGVKIALPHGTVGMVCPRSGLAAKHGISIVNAPGIIDEGYRGEIMVVLHNTDLNSSFEVERGDRIAQLVVVPYLTCEVTAVDELDDTERGDGMCGSTGVK